MNKIFSLDELKNYDGKNDRKAFVAVDGLVYDLTNSPLWEQGEHMSKVSAGRDLSLELKKISPHKKDVLDKFEIVGVLEGYENLLEKKDENIKIDESTHKSRFHYLSHIHPFLVHFPIVFFPFSFFFGLLSVIFSSKTFYLISFYMLFLGTFFSFFALFSGFLAWKIRLKYAKIQEIRFKIILSILLILISVPTLLYEFLFLITLKSSNIIFLFSLFLLTVLVLVIGFLGGKIDFPD